MRVIVENPKANEEIGIDYSTGIVISTENNTYSITKDEVNNLVIKCKRIPHISVSNSLNQIILI